MKMKMKRILSLILSLVLIACLATGCGKTETETDTEVNTEDNTEVKSGEKVKVAVSINTYNNFHKVFYEAIEEYAKDNNIELQMVDAQGKVEKQISDVENLLATNPDAFILLPVDADALGVSVDAIKEAGIPLVESSTWTKNDKYDVFVGANDTMVGECQGEYIAKYLDENPDVNLKVGYLRILLGSPLDKARYEGLVSSLKEYIDAGRFEIIGDKDGLATGDYSSSMTVTEDWMQAFPEMNCIIGQNDGTAVAALQAVKGADKIGDVLIVGCDGEDPAISAIKAGEMSMTGLMEPALWGRTCIETVNGLLNGEKYDHQILIAPTIITKENADKVNNFTIGE